MSVESFKPPCGHCGVNIEYPSLYSGKTVECPSCRASVNLPISPAFPPRPQGETVSLPEPEREVPAKPHFVETPTSGVATLLEIFAYVELLAAPIAGYVLGQETSATVGWSIFITCFVSGLMLLGFSRLVEYGWKATRTLESIEKLLKEKES